MKIVFLSNFFNHHQSFLSDALWKLTKQNYTFVESVPVPRERVRMGYGQEKAPYVQHCRKDRDAVLEQVGSADLVIAGSAPEKLIRRRIRDGKLVFRYSERPLKLGFQAWKYPYRMIKWHWRNPPGKPVYLLCASAYAAEDYAKFGMFRGRTYKWGYFPETKHYEDPKTLMAGKDPARILWCGRFLDWKHPEAALEAARRLKQDGYSFRLSYIGGGDREKALRTMVRDYDLADRVEFLGTMKPEEVRQHMEQAGIFLFTSDKMEGWGAVLNESMNSGCAVIASHAIGAVPFLLKDGENGLVYRSGDGQMLYEKLRNLLDHPEKQRQLGRAAYETIVSEWNAEVAARRVVHLAQAILDGDPSPDLYKTGPCSRAEKLGDH